MQDAPRQAGRLPPASCPICGQPTEERYRPFCSRRCADLDLARWLNGAYVVPGGADADEDGDASPRSGTESPADAEVARKD